MGLLALPLDGHAYLKTRDLLSRFACCEILELCTMGNVNYPVP